MPLHTAEIRHRQPRLIEVQKDLTLLQKPNVPQSPFLPQDLILRGIEVKGGLDDLAVLHVEVLAHHVADSMLLDIEPHDFLDAYLDLFDGVNDCFLYCQVGNIIINLVSLMKSRALLGLEFMEESLLLGGLVD